MVYDGGIERYNDPRVVKVQPHLAFLFNHYPTASAWINPLHELLQE